MNWQLPALADVERFYAAELAHPSVGSPSPQPVVAASALQAAPSKAEPRSKAKIALGRKGKSKRATAVREGTAGKTTTVKTAAAATKKASVKTAVAGQSAAETKTEASAKKAVAHQRKRK